MPYASLKEVFPGVSFGNGSYGFDARRFNRLPNNGTTRHGALVDTNGMQLYENENGVVKGIEGFEASGGMPVFSQPKSVTTQNLANQYGGNSKFLKGSMKRYNYRQNAYGPHEHVYGNAPKARRDIEDVQVAPSGMYLDRNYGPFGINSGKVNGADPFGMGTGEIGSLRSNRNSTGLKPFTMDSAMEMALAEDTEAITCNGCVGHLKNCPDCKHRALMMLDSSQGGSANLLESQIPFRERDTGKTYTSGRLNGGILRMNGNKSEELLELLMFIGTGAFLVLIMNNLMSKNNN